MRFTVMVQLEKPEIPKDKNRLLLSLVKHWLERDNPEVYQQLYGSRESIRKDFTCSVYLGNCKFLRDTIEVPEKRILFNVSSYDLNLGICLYNALLKGKGQEYSYKNIPLLIKDILLQREKTITTDTVYFQTMSPCVVREHNPQTNRDWFYSLSEEKGKQLLLENLRVQILESLPEARYDIDEMQIEVRKNKEVKVKHYGIEVLSNICELEIKAKPYLLDYFYKAGVGSLKSTGFGMLQVR